MKPILIYAMPRTQSTVILYSTKRKTRLTEPFDGWQLFGRGLKYTPFYPEEFNTFDKAKWNSIFQTYNDPDTAIKFLGNCLFLCLPARKWYQQVLETQSHDIFVPMRNLEDMLLSNLVALHFGYHKNTEKPLQEITIPETDFFGLNLSFDSFIRFFPTYGKVVSYDSLPESHFDKSLHNMIPQHSLDKAKYITNLDFCMEKISHLVKYYKPEYDKKISSLL
jgi:hypothetical protein